MPAAAAGDEASAAARAADGATGGAHTFSL